MSSSPPPTGFPARLGRYELLSVIGRGAMGLVYEAKQDGLDRHVALKVVAAGRLASEDELRRFRTEANAASRLRHPGIVPIHDLGEEDGHHYLVMDLVRGPSLQERLKDGPLAPADAARIVRDLSEALEFAHARGVVHRDVKPANVLLDDDGRPLLTDFGLARTHDDDSSLTIEGAPLGTPGYMSPEQAEGLTARIGPRTDVHAIGALLYALLTGRAPYASNSAVQTLQMVRERDPVPPRILDPNVPRDLETICLTALQKDPSRRYRSAAALGADLRRWLAGEPITARPVGRVERIVLGARRRPLVAALLTTVAVVTIGGAALVTWNWLRAEDALERAEAARVDRIRAEVAALGKVSPAAFLPALEALPADDPVVDEALRRAAGSAEPRVRFRTRLAQLALAPASVGDLGVDPFVDAPDAHERALAISVVRRALDAAPAPAGDRFLAAVARRVGDVDAGAHHRTVALMLAFALDAGAPGEAPDLAAFARTVVGLDPFELSAASFLLDPLHPALRRELEHIARTGDGAPRRQATSLLCRASAADPRPLARLVGALEPTELALVAEAVRAAGDPPALLDLLRRIVDDPALPAGPPPPALERDAAAGLAAFGGAAGDGGAYATSVPAEALPALIEALADAAYRPTRIRPRRCDGGSIRFAVAWTRDGAPFDWTVDASRVELASRVAEVAPDLIPVDVASYSADGERRHVLLCAPPPDRVLRADLLVDVSAARYAEQEEQLLLLQYMPAGFHADPDGSGRLSFVMHRHESALETLFLPFPSGPDGGPDAPPGYAPVDISLERFEAGSPALTGLFAPRGDEEVRVVVAPTETAHAARTHALLEEGFGVRALSLLPDGATTAVASVCSRPLPGADEVVARERRATEAAALLAHAGELGPALSLLGDVERPGARARIGGLLADSDLDPAPLVFAIDGGDPARAMGLLRALASFEPRRFDLEARRALEATAGALRDHASAGVRAAARWCLDALGASDPQPDDVGLGPNGHRFVTITPAGPFLMGSTRSDPHCHRREEPHLRVIDRDYALAERETTFGRFQRFLAEQDGFDTGVRGPADQPADRVTWYQAVAYCRWLGEIEGIPEEQQCYPSLDVIGAAWSERRPAEELPLDDDFLERTGYRLPTEAEWEYACRAGTRSPRWFGFDESLLAAYVTCRATGARRRPAGSTPPNDFGLQDMLGSVYEWCQGPLHDYEVGPAPVLDRAVGQVGQLRVLRGGSYDTAPRRLRAAARLPSSESDSGPGIGFRVARTIR